MTAADLKSDSSGRSVVGPAIHSALPERQHFPLVAKGFFQPPLPSWYEHKPVKHRGVSLLPHTKRRHPCERTREGSFKVRAAQDFPLSSPGCVPRAISGATPRKLLSGWKLQGWHPQVVTELLVQPEQSVSLSKSWTERIVPSGQGFQSCPRAQAELIPLLQLRQQLQIPLRRG